MEDSKEVFLFLNFDSWNIFQIDARMRHDWGKNEGSMSAENF